MNYSPIPLKITITKLSQIRVQPVNFLVRTGLDPTSSTWWNFLEVPNFRPMYVIYTPQPPGNTSQTLNVCLSNSVTWPAIWFIMNLTFLCQIFIHHQFAMSEVVQHRAKVHWVSVNQIGTTAILLIEQTKTHKKSFKMWWRQKLYYLVTLKERNEVIESAGVTVKRSMNYLLSNHADKYLNQC